MQVRLHIFVKTAVLLVALVSLTACGGNSAASSPAATAPNAASFQTKDYVLGVGDTVRVTTFGEKDLSGQFPVAADGTISLALVGSIKAAGLTAPQLEQAITRKLSNGYMKDPHVSVEVVTYRPFFIVGEVMKPGSYHFVNGMTVINGVAMAGGYTYRADKDDIKLKHGGVEAKEEHATESTPVYPGDVIDVPERFF